jgi:hypothetical protein
MGEEGRERERLEQIAKMLREATCDAIERGSPLARSLDDVRNELARQLMLERRDAAEYRRVLSRAHMLLDAWRNMSGASVPRSG